MMGTRIHVLTLLVVLGMGAGLLGCRAGQPAADASATLIPTATPLPALPAPSTLLGKTTAMSATIRQGSEYDPALAPQRVTTTAGTDAAFAPDWTAGSSSFDGLAYAMYVFPWDGDVDSALITPDWTGAAPADSLVWIGLANANHDTWNWFPAADGVVKVDSVAEYTLPSDEFFVTLVILGDVDYTLDRIVFTTYFPALLSYFGEPLSGAGLPDDPYVVDARLTSFFTLYYLPEGNISGDPLASYFVEPSAAGTVLPHIEEASLHLADGFTGAYQVGAAYGGFPSEPQWIYFSAVDNGPGVNVPPVAALTAAPTYGAPPLEVGFNGKGSADADGVIVDYRWDFDGDGTPDQTGADRVTSHAYSSAGTYQATLEVEDDQGATHQVSVPITIEDSSATWHVVKVREFVEGEYSNVGRYCGLCDVGGQPAIAFSETKEPSQLQRLSYFRADDALGAAWGAPVVLKTMTWDEESTGINVQLKLIDGQPAVGYGEHLWTGSKWRYQLFYQRAADAVGGDWSNLRKLADATADVNRGTHCQMLDLSGVPALSYFDASEQQLMFVTGQDAAGLAWDAPQILDAPGVNPDIYSVGEYNSLALVAGRPALTYLARNSVIGDPEKGNEVRFLRATDAAGSAWNAPVVVAMATQIGQGTALLELTGGVPGVAYQNVNASDNTSLTYSRGSSADGGTWSTGLDILTMGYWDMPVTPQLYLYGGKPVLACLVQGGDWVTHTNVTFCRGAEANGGSWQAAEIVDDFGDSSGVSSCLVGGKPALCYSNEDEDALYFAIYY